MRGGWFQTGAAAVVHPNGYIEIRDRLKDVILSAVENISLVEVEGVSPLQSRARVQAPLCSPNPSTRWMS
jgi:fatty-acyl-CoA synthase